VEKYIVTQPCVTKWCGVAVASLYRQWPLEIFLNRIATASAAANYHDYIISYYQFYAVATTPHTREKRLLSTPRQLRLENDEPQCGPLVSRAHCNEVRYLHSDLGGETAC
jgi:hypothetical protein